MIEITTKGRERALEVNNFSPALCALSKLESGPCSTGELIVAMRVSPDQGKRILKIMSRQRLIRRAEGTD